MKSLRIIALSLLTVWSTTQAQSSEYNQNPLREGKQITLKIGFEKSANSDPVLWPLLVTYALEKKNHTASPGEMFHEILRIGDCFGHVCASCGAPHVNAKPFNIAMIAEVGIEDSSAVSRPCMMLEDAGDSIQKITYSFTAYRDDYSSEQWNKIADEIAQHIVNFDPAQLANIVDLLTI